MLREHAPVLREGDSVMLSRHDDVMFALRNPEIFSSDMDAIDIGNVRPLIPLQVNAPEHVKFRRLLDPLFAPRAVAPLEQKVRSLVNELIDEFVERGSCEFNAELAIPLPCTVFLELLGLPQRILTCSCASRTTSSGPPPPTRTTPGASSPPPVRRSTRTSSGSSRCVAPTRATT